MFLQARPSAPTPLRSFWSLRSTRSLGSRIRSTSRLGAAAVLLASFAAAAAPSAAAVAPARPAAVPASVPAAHPAAPPAPAPPSAPAARVAVPVSSLAMTGTITTVTVHRIYRRGQAQWVNHVLDTRLVDLNGCQAERTRATRSGSTYTSTVRTVCVDGPARAEAAARRLVRDRPWYQVEVVRVGLVGFGLLADLPEGNDRAFAAAVAQLPKGAFTFAEGDDLSVNYVGQGVTQAQLDAAVVAFAAALGIATAQVEISPLAAG